MKKIIFIIFLFLLISPNVFAQNDSSSSASGNSVDQNIINKVVSIVPKLNLVEKKGFMGKVTDINSTQITVSDLSGNTRFIDVDEFTKFSSPDNDSDSFGISDIKKGDMIGVLGLYHKDSRRTLARFVNVLDLPRFISGVVASKDTDNFDIIVAMSNGNQKVSIESVTKTYVVDSEGKMTKSGFAQITTGENVVVSGFTDPKDTSALTAGRAILFPDTPQNPAIDIEVQDALPVNASAIPSTGSGLKLTPISK